ncbi:hypothetical protein [Granulicella sp. L60]|uniref:hypothetical protein n=1 Tax=Granulicella sp. L60 TaxID=1641866 RepID=UPI00352ABA29
MRLAELSVGCGTNDFAEIGGVFYLTVYGIQLVSTENIAPAPGMRYGGRLAILPGQSGAEEFSILRL